MTVLKQGPPIQCSIALKKKPTEKLLFESFPQTIAEGYQVMYDSKRGRTTVATYAYYKGGDYSPFQLTLKFVAGLHGKVNKLSNMTVGGQTYIPSDEQREKIALDTALQNMEAKVRWMQALCFPRPDKPRASANKLFVVAGTPPKILITYGRFMTIEGQAQNVAITWGPKFHPDSARPYEAAVALSIKRIGTFYIDWYDVSKIASRRSPNQFSTGATGIFKSVGTALSLAGFGL